MLVRVTGWNDDLKAGFATMREMKVMSSSFGQKVAPTAVLQKSSAYDSTRCSSMTMQQVRCGESSPRSQVPILFRSNNALVVCE